LSFPDFVPFGALMFMWVVQRTAGAISRMDARVERANKTRRASTFFHVCIAASFSLSILAGESTAEAQVSVVTAHNDIARTGQNLSETILTPTNVNSNANLFGKVFSQPVDGQIFAQPLYVPNVTIASNKGVHKVVYVATYSDYVYAFDADSDGGSDSAPLWQVSLLTNSTPAGTYTSLYGVTGTPVIDASTSTSDSMAQTIFLVSSEAEGATDVYRLHALDIRSGAEKLGGPFLIQATVAGTGSGSSGGNLGFNALYQRQRAALLLLNGVVYVAFASINDIGPWHGWIFSYGMGTNPSTNAPTLRQLDVFCTSANGSGAGVWMAGAGLAAEVNNPTKPYGRMFVATGNGSFGITVPSAGEPPYSNPQDEYGMSVLDLDLTGGVMTVEDEFTPYDQALLNGQDGDLGSGGPVLLPAQTLASGKTLDPLVEVGKSGMIYILNRDNNNDGSNTGVNPYSPAGLGGFNATADQVVKEVQTPIAGEQGWGAGVWGTSAYWNGNLYFGGTSPALSNGLTAYSFKNGALSTTPTSKSNEQFIYPAPTPSISANGNTNGIVWVLDNHAYFGGGSAALLAYDATNLANLLYSSNANLARDDPGQAVEFAVPTIANGKVYTGQANLLNAYGLLGATPTAPAPVIGPGTRTFSGSLTVTIADAVAGATIYYTTNGSKPTAGSTLYTGPFAINSSETITAIASVTGDLLSAPAAAIFISTSNATNPVFSLAARTYSGAQSLTITDVTTGATICYTVYGSTPTTASTCYTAASHNNAPLTLAIPVTETVEAVATAPGLQNSAVVSATYNIAPVYAINFAQGFTDAVSSGLMQFNGSTDLDDFRLQLTNGEDDEAGSAFYTRPVNIAAFTTDFTFQLSNPQADGMTFTIQGVGATALGAIGGGLGYAGIPKSVAIKFDLYNNGGEGSDSTGLFTSGNSPTVPAIDLTNTPINLHSGDYFDAHITYDGLNLTMTLTDSISLQSWSHAWPINIPAAAGGNTAYMGFTAGTGGLSSSQKITSWTLAEGPPAVPTYPLGFDNIMMYYTGAWLNGTSVQLTSGGQNEDNSVYYYFPLDIESFTTDFDFQIAQGIAGTPLGDGFTFAIQNAAQGIVGGGGGGLGYYGIPNSLAIKFDLYNNAGEGNDSTGLYLNGAIPTLPAMNLANSLVLLSSGDLMHAQITYDGANLTWEISDKSSPVPEIFTETVAINIPQTIGSNTAYVGFTGASGGATAIQRILDWTYSNAP
jgi:Bacterial lectin/Chitobiase/beta-hexosaminidase C-terminal domain